MELTVGGRAMTINIINKEIIQCVKMEIQREIKLEQGKGDRTR